MGLFRNKERLALRELCGKPLISYTIDQALKAELIDRIIVSTEDQEIAEFAKKCGAEVPFLRPMNLANASVPIDDILRDVLNRLKDGEGYEPNIVVVLQYNTPFVKECHYTEAIDSLLLYDTDSVISVTKDITFHWKPGKYGLTPVGYRKGQLREDRETIYKECGAVYAIKTVNLQDGGYLGETIGHIELSKFNARRVEEDFDIWLSTQIMLNKGICDER